MLKSIFIFRTLTPNLHSLSFCLHFISFTSQVPVQRVTKYPLLLSRLLKVTPAHHEDRSALQESRERIEHHLENMNQEARDTNSTRLWRRISMINVSSYRKMDSQLDVLGNTTWGIRKVSCIAHYCFQ